MERPQLEDRATEAVVDDEAIGEPRATESEQRRYVRKSVIWGGRADTKDGTFDCLVLNISRSGAKLRCSAPMPDQTTANLAVGSFGMLNADVIWQRGDKMGIRFTVDPEQVANSIGQALAL